jgi:hypothetical protein
MKKYGAKGANVDTQFHEYWSTCFKLKWKHTHTHTRNADITSQISFLNTVEPAEQEDEEERKKEKVGVRADRHCTD